jgi:hypothetical protein
MEDLRMALGPFYQWIKAVHVFFAAIWGFSTMVAWVYYLKPTLRSALRHPDDDARRARRDEFMERFDRGAAIEHVAFAVMVATALLMLWLARVDLARWSFLTAMLWIGVLVIAPMEAVDIWLSHLSGNKAKIRATGDMDRYEQVMRWHWTFFRVTEPLVIVLVPTMFILAIVKPF